jgi:hypothetical protein
MGRGCDGMARVDVQTGGGSDRWATLGGEVAREGARLGYALGRLAVRRRCTQVVSEGARGRAATRPTKRTRCREGELSWSAISVISIDSPPASLPSTTSLISEMVLSRLRRRVLGLVLVVPSDCLRPWPGRHGLSGPSGELGEPGEPLGEPNGGVAEPFEAGLDGVASIGETVPKMSRLNTGGEDGSANGELGCDCEGEAGHSSSAWRERDGSAECPVDGESRQMR